ncbi:hypothetical protein BJ138DRAFT_1097868 [Hygrophoropsis aurantiaca]|uniref:Uncharacterized protein n=1 Tax=Hygrophoropsis aurantiaca TaxID=72124 RepID=A0ACB8AQ00_9AGAM|nr:hypothetical protein BJ138DRAFT_1097868 [Hygrophoropsis aurantiaca]
MQNHPSHNDGVISRSLICPHVHEVPSEDPVLVLSLLYGRDTLYRMACSLIFSIGPSGHDSHRRLHSAFASIGDPSPEEIYLAITTDDASIVYYKISKGIVKPPV